MEERKTIFHYLGQIFMIYGITLAILNILCMFFGESAKEYSAIFSLGCEGVSIPIMVQFVVLSAIIVILRFLFFTDAVIKNMSVTARTICMILLVLVTISIFIIMFDWFPADKWQPWGMFFVCFAFSFVVSTWLSVSMEKAENKKMEEALKRLKQQGNKCM